MGWSSSGTSGRQNHDRTRMPGEYTDRTDFTQRPDATTLLRDCRRGYLAAQAS